MVNDSPGGLADVVGEDLGAGEVEAAVSTARWYSQAARELQEADGWHDTVQRIVELSVEVAGADLAVLIGIGKPGGTPDLLAATDYASAMKLVAFQRAAGAAPAWQAILDRMTVHVADLTSDPRWGKFTDHDVTGLAYQSVLAFCLLIDDQPLAALALYGREPGAFGEEQVELAAAFTEHATIAFNQAAQAEHITNLELALDHARDIGAAIGIIMERLRITQRDAFTRLRKASQDQNRKLYELAVRVMQTGELPFEQPQGGVLSAPKAE